MQETKYWGGCSEIYKYSCNRRYIWCAIHFHHCNFHIISPPWKDQIMDLSIQYGQHRLYRTAFRRRLFSLPLCLNWFLRIMWKIHQLIENHRSIYFSTLLETDHFKYITMCQIHNHSIDSTFNWFRFLCIPWTGCWRMKNFHSSYFLILIELYCWTRILIYCPRIHPMCWWQVSSQDVHFLMRTLIWVDHKFVIQFSRQF